MDKQLSSNRDESSGGDLGGGQQKRRRDDRPSNNMRPQHMNNNANFNNRQGWNDNRRDYQHQGRGGGPGRGPPGRGGGRGFDNRGRGMNNMRGNDNNMRGPNDMRDNNMNMNGPPQYQQQQGRGGRGDNMPPQHQQHNNQGYAQQQQQQQQRFDGQQQGRGFIPQQGRGDNNMTAGRGRGRGDMPGRGRGRTQQQQTSQTDLQKSQTPIPPNERRTLILSNIPPSLKYHQIQNHLSSVLNVKVQYCTIDNNTTNGKGEAYVRFKYVNDAIKVWDGGTEGLDGKNNGGNKNINGEDGEQINLVQLGVQLKAVHFTNFMIAPSKERGQQSGGSGRGSGSMSSGGGGRGGEGRGFDRKRNWDQQQGQSNGDQYDTPQSSSAAAASSTQSTPNYPTNTKYHRSPQKKQLSPIEIQLQEQKQLEEQKAYEEFQLQEKEWRKRRKAEYDIFMTAKQSREAHLSTLQQKKDLLSKQESMLDKQLPLHKKMLTVLKSKNAELSEQSKKMKEILSTQTRIMEIKKEIKGLVETIEKLKQEEVTKGVFRPTEKRPIFSSADTDGSSKKKKARLDRRTTVLKVEGFNNDVTEDAVKEHFKCCTSVNIETQDDKTFAIVNFANRVHAEKAKSSTIKFNDQDLTCTWHNLPSAASKEAAGSITSNQDQTALKNSEEFTDQAAKDDVDMNVDEEEGLYDDFGGDVFDIEPPPDGNEEEAVDYDEDEDLVDYD